MPADTSKQSKRRPEKHFTHEELKVVQQKRLRGELSCAECRRLKLRCDKKVPCSSCVRRGCGSICPSGILEAGVGTRFVLASTNQLHNKISIMSARIRALEDALAILQSTVTTEKHPLLDEQFLKIKFTSDIPFAPGDDGRNAAMQEGASSSTGASTADMSELDSFGTLTIGENREVTYFGTSAGNEALLVAQEDLLDLAGEAESEFNEKQDDGFMSMMTASPRSTQPPDSNHSRSWSTEAHDSSANATSSSASANSPESVQSPPSVSEAPSTLPPELCNLPLGEAWSLYGGQNATELTVPALLKHMPSYERARALAQLYVDYGSVFFRPITKDELMDIVLPQIYAFLSKPVGGNSTPAPTFINNLDGSESTFDGPSPHLLAFIFFIFALGAYFDFSLYAPSYETEAELWFQLGRKALVSGRGFIAAETNTDTENHSNAIGAFPSSSTGSSSSGSVPAISTTFAAPPCAVGETICALGLMANYISLANKKYSRDSAWCIIGVAAKLAQSAGLHRDPVRWGLPPKVIQKRRRVFWEIFQADLINSLALGRPPCIPLSYVDCEYPTDEEATLDDKGNVMVGLWQLKYNFTRDGYVPVANAVLTVKLLSYAGVMEIDQQIRQIPIPPTFRPVVTKESEGEEAFHDGVLSLRDFYGSQFRNAILVYLHRPFFAHAMLSYPSNPLSSPFASSFLTAYRASSETIKAALNLFDRSPELFSRMWFITYHVFSAALVVGSVVRRCPSSTIAPSALMDLSMAVELYEKHAYLSRRHQVACFVLKKLRTRATRAYADLLATRSPGSPENTSFMRAEAVLDSDLFSAQKLTEFEENMAIFAGKTKVLTKRKKTKDSTEKSRDDSSRIQSDAGSPYSSVTDSPSPPSDGGIGGYPQAPSHTLPSHPSLPVPNDTSAAAQDCGLGNVAMPIDFNLGNDFNFDVDLGFGMDSGGGMVMNMALEDIHMGNDTQGTQNDTAGSSFNPGFLDSGSASSLMSYMGGADVKVAPTTRLDNAGPYSSSSSYPQTATAQAAMMYGMGLSTAQYLPSPQSSSSGVGTASTSTGTTNSPPAGPVNPQIDAAELYSMFTEYLARKQSPTIPPVVPNPNTFGDTMSFGQGASMMGSSNNFALSSNYSESSPAQLGQAGFVQQSGGFSWQPQSTSANVQGFSNPGGGSGASSGGPELPARDYEMFFKLLGLDGTQM